jgi:hypothetical protein
MKNIIKLKIFSLEIYFGLILFFSPGFLHAEILFLKDGSVLYGTIIKETDTHITFTIKKKKVEKSYKRKDVLRVRYDDTELKTKFIYKKDGTFIKGFIVDEDAEKILIRENLYKMKEIPIQRMQISSISDKKLEKKKLFYIFKLNDPSSQLAIEGDFTGWVPMEMKKVGENWEKKIEIDILKKNDYQYRYIKNNNPDKTRFIKFKVKDGKLFEDIDLYKFTIGLRAGGALYTSGYADKIEAQQPVISMIGKINLPFIWDALAFQGEVSYFKHSPIKNKNRSLTGLNVETSNYLLAGNLVYDFFIFKRVGLHPKLGGGYCLQNTKVTGSMDENLNNSFPLLSGGFELSYQINRYIYTVLAIQNFIELENGTITLLNAATLGVNFRI